MARRAVRAPLCQAASGKYHAPPQTHPASRSTVLPPGRSPRLALRAAAFIPPWPAASLEVQRRPSLRDICTLLNTYLRLRTAEEKERQSTSRFKTFGTPEENYRRFEQDIRRAYGNHSPSAGEQAGSPVAARSPPASPPAQARVPPPPPPTRPARDKCDVMAVPLVRLPSGLMVCDWSRARPA